MAKFTFLLVLLISLFECDVAISAGNIDQSSPGALAAKAYVDKVFNPAMAKTGWKAVGYGSTSSPVQSYVWITPGGECSSDDFLMDITDPTHPKVLYILQSLGLKGKDVYNKYYSEAIQHILIPVAQDITAIGFNIDLAKDLMKGAKTKVTTEDEKEATDAYQFLTELSAAGSQLKRSFGNYSAGKYVEARNALPKPKACVTSTPVANTAVVTDAHIAAKKSPRGDSVPPGASPGNSTVGK